VFTVFVHGTHKCLVRERLFTRDASRGKLRYPVPAFRYTSPSPSSEVGGKQSPGETPNMRKELEQRLVERWPTWFNTGGDIRYTAMPWGFAHDDGWFDILWRLCEDLEPLGELGEGRCIKTLCDQHSGATERRTTWLS
jgi:hypothetical protein